MKKSLSLLLLTSGLGLYSQPSYHYKFKLSGVSNLGDAKMITDPLRNKFKTYPTFIDMTDYFEFDSQVDLTEVNLSGLLNPLNYTLIEFGKKVNLSQPEINIKEK